ncbi:recombinase zinc beta ribbon domain-containing protein [Saccharopolyspora shandongensis]|uniref:recombinase zinc beta ribbon domain-containing protein n=1 Tax=Saccharopolyspora shandongensis TaxID=418495 RepID=UPI00340165CB
MELGLLGVLAVRGDGPTRTSGRCRRRSTIQRLVNDATFLAVWGKRAARKTQDGGTRTYVLAGLVVCGLCERRLDSHWVNNGPGYRCRHGHTSARNRPPEFVKNVYVREDRLLAGLRRRLSNAAGDQDTS